MDPTGYWVIRFHFLPLHNSFSSVEPVGWSISVYVQFVLLVHKQESTLLSTFTLGKIQ